MNYFIKLSLRVLLSSFFLINSTFVFSVTRKSALNVYVLAPQNGGIALDLSLKELSNMKQRMGSYPSLFSLISEKTLMRKIIGEAGLIFEKYGLEKKSFSSRAKFVLNLLSTEDFKKSAENEYYIKYWNDLSEEISLFVTSLEKNSFDYLDSKGRLNIDGRWFLKTFKQPHVAGLTSNGRSFSFEQSVDFNLCVEWFLLALGKDTDEKFNEIFALEQQRLLKELIQEQQVPGSGNLTDYIFITDTHGGDDRLFPLVAHALGVASADYKGIKTLKELKVCLDKIGALDENGNIKPEIKAKIRFVGFSDMQDRGDRYLAVREGTEWLKAQGILDFVSGNHDQWLASGTQRIQYLEEFKEFFEPDGDTGKLKYIGPDDLRGDLIAFWAWEVMTHAGWITNSVDEINERRYNNLVTSLNDSFNLDLKNIELVKFRESNNGPAKRMKELKKRNNVIREGDAYSSGENNDHRGGRGWKNIYEALSHNLIPLKDFERKMNKIFYQNLDEVKKFAYYLQKVLPIIKSIEGIDNDILDDVLYELKNDISLDEKQLSDIEHLIFYLERYAFGDGTLGSALVYYETIEEDLAVLKDDNILVKDAALIIKKFNRLYPLPDILDSTINYLIKEFDILNQELKSKDDLDVKKVKDFIKNKIHFSLITSQEYLMKSYDATLLLIRRQKLDGKIDENQVRKLRSQLDEQMKVKQDKVDLQKNQVNKVLQEDVISQLSYYFKEMELLTFKNLFEDIEIRNHALWNSINNDLLKIDSFGNSYLHALLPYSVTEDDNGKKRIAIDVNFRGKKGFRAITAMESALKRFYSPLGKIGALPNFEVYTKILWDEVGDALVEINKWYSEKTNFGKAQTLKELFDISIYEDIFMLMAEEGAGLNNSNKAMLDQTLLNILIGHNPYKKREGKTGIPYASGSLINADDGMSRGYTHTGVYIKVTAYGIERFGFAADDASEITDLTNLALRTDAKGNGILYEQLATELKGTVGDIAKQRLYEFTHRKEILALRIIETKKACVKEYEGLLRYAQKSNNQSLIKHYKEVLVRIDKISSGPLSLIKQSELVVTSS